MCGEREACRAVGRCRFLTLLVAFVLLGCAPLQPIDPGQPVELSSKQGLLIVDIDTELPIRLLLMDSGYALRDIEQGRQVWMVRLRAGEYRWRELRIDRSGTRGAPQFDIRFAAMKSTISPLRRARSTIPDSSASAAHEAELATGDLTSSSATAIGWVWPFGRFEGPTRNASTSVL